jgi:hypothetical protein
MEQEYVTDEGQLLVVLDGNWRTERQLDAMFRSILYLESATPETREQHMRIANSLPRILDSCMRKGLVSSSA